MKSTSAPASAGTTPPTTRTTAGAARAWPQFFSRRVAIEGSVEKFRVFFPCDACGRNEIVDDATDLCRECWRQAVLGPTAIARVLANLGLVSAESTSG